MKHIIDNDNLHYTFLLFLSFVFLLLFSYSTSPLYLIDGRDSIVFKTMGLAICNGRIPYVDIFDHKGPVFYLIQTMAEYVHWNRWGLFLIQYITLSISSITWYKIAKIYVSPFKSLISILLIFFLYFYMIEGGNFTEEYSLLFISLSFLTTIKILHLEESNNRRFLCIGLCLGCVFFIRPNDAVAFIGGQCLGLFIYYLIYHVYDQISKLILYVGLGVGIISIPICSYFSYHNAMHDLWYCLIEYNTLYSEGLLQMILECFSVAKGKFIPILLSVIALCIESKDKKTLCILLPITILAYIFLGSRLYTHYLIVWIPTVFLMFWIFVFKQKNKLIILFAFFIYCLMPIRSGNILKTPYHYYAHVKSYFNQSNNEKKCIKQSQKLFNNLSIKDRDSIWAYNLAWNNDHNTYKILYQNRIIQCNRTSVIFMADIDSIILEDITRETPKYILFSKQDKLPNRYFFRDSSFIDNHYCVLDTINNPDIILYKRTSWQN